MESAEHVVSHVIAPCTTNIVAASERSERAAILIVTGFLWSMWPSRLGHD